GAGDVCDMCIGSIADGGELFLENVSPHDWSGRTACCDSGIGEEVPDVRRDISIARCAAAVWTCCLGPPVSSSSPTPGDLRRTGGRIFSLLAGLRLDLGLTEA